MYRLGLATIAAVVLASSVRADDFERYTNPVLGKIAEADGVKELKRLTTDLVFEHNRVLPNSNGVLLVVKTNGGANSKLVVHMARQRAGKDSVPIALIDRYVTYKASQERAVQASGQNVHLYNGFLLNLDIGQIVPKEVGGDLRFVVEGDQGYLEPIGKAKLYLVTKPVPGTEAKKTDKPTIGDVFEPRYFTGKYKLHDDGRRSAILSLKVDDEGQVTGEYISDKTGQKYEVTGKVTNPKNMIQFTVKLPATQQTFQGWMFTRDGSTICGVTRLQEHEFGFYAVRAEE